jgi:uncharacterized protein (TIGR03546 family)
MSSDTDPRQISLGFSLGMVLGLTPLANPHNLLVLLAILFFRVNISAAFLSWAVFTILAFLLDPIFHQLGFFVLTQMGILGNLWTALYNMPLIPYTHFNNSVLMGSLIFSLLVFYPVYSGGKFMIVKYREVFMERFNNWKITHILKASSIYKWYTRYSNLRE